MCVVFACLPFPVRLTTVTLPLRVTRPAWSQRAVRLSVRPVMCAPPDRRVHEGLGGAGGGLAGPVAVVGGRLCAVNVAVTLWSEPIVMSHAPVPEHAPLQPVNADPAAAVGVSDTTVPAA